jgi:hypothetical protein
MSNNNDRYLSPAYASPKSPYQSPIIGKSTPPSMARSSSYDPHRALGYFDIPSRSAPSSPQVSYTPFTPQSRSASPAREARRSREFNNSHSGSDLEDALVRFNLVPNWLKLAMEQDQPVMGVKPPQTPRNPSSPLNSPNSVVTSPNPNTHPIQTPYLNLTIPQGRNVKVAELQEAAEISNAKPSDDEDRLYWEQEEDEGYWAEMEENDEDLEEAYRSVQ